MKPALPHPALRACVVVPARNEQDLIASALRSLAAQTGIEPYEYEVLIVLDNCTDATEKRARQVADDHPQLRLHLLDDHLVGRAAWIGGQAAGGDDLQAVLGWKAPAGDTISPVVQHHGDRNRHGRCASPPDRR